MRKHELLVESTIEKNCYGHPNYLREVNVKKKLGGGSVAN